MTWPPLWAGLAVGAAFGVFIGRVGAPMIFPLIGALVAAGATTIFLSALYGGLKGVHTAETLIERKRARDARLAPVLQLREDLAAAGLWAESDHLHKIVELADEIVADCEGIDPLPEQARRTLELADALEQAALERCRDAVDLKRRLELATGDRAAALESDLTRCRAELSDAFDALVASRGMLRKQLRRADSGDDKDLATITEQLREETEFSERLEARLSRDGILGGIELESSEFDDSDDSDTPRSDSDQEVS